MSHCKPALRTYITLVILTTVLLLSSTAFPGAGSMVGGSQSDEVFPSPNMDFSRPISFSEGAEPVKTGKAPKRGACTSLAPGNPAVIVAGSSAGAGPAVAKAAAKTNKSLTNRRCSALTGTSTEPSNAKATSLATIHTTVGDGPPKLPSPPVDPQPTSSGAADTGDPGLVSSSGEGISDWQVANRKGKGKKPIKQAQRPSNVPTVSTAPASQDKRRVRLTRKERRQERRRGGKAPQPKQFTTTKPASSMPRFSAGSGPQSVAGTSRSPSDQSPAQAATTTQPLAGKAQAVAKRALNETISPRGERKRPRLDKSRREASRSYAQAAGDSLSVAVTCDRTGTISQEVADQVLAAITSRIISEACSAKKGTPGPMFDGKPRYAGGVLKLWCNNDHTLTWLKETVSGLTLSASAPLVVRSQSEILKRVRCGIAIPDDQGLFGDSQNIGRALSYQNPWVDVSRWLLLHADKQNACWFLILGIPEDQIQTLMDADRRLCLGPGRVYVKFQGLNGRFVDVPRGWDRVTGQLQCAGGNPPTTSDLAAPVADTAVTVEPAATADTVDAAPPSGGEPDDISLSPASDLGELGFDEGDLFAGLRLGGDEEGVDVKDGDPSAADP
ncbi:hypothetical protein PYW07_016909 [Mythimna separata]|uniref:DUF4780 domain-containing protein n=1 Tax=Mythimna separata TaxID=271217 RepID=A0AAD7YVD8_MYTSE|nr:hypothetical protein PYW07_016909 [Mythimna separata]